MKNQTELHKLTHTATLRLTPVGSQVKIAVLDKNFNGTQREEYNDIELLAEAALRIAKSLSYRAAFHRMTLTQHPAETRALDSEITVRVSQTFASASGFANMSLESETAELL